MTFSVVSCFLYWSALETESDDHLKRIWTRLFEQEVTHLHLASKLLEDYEGKHWQQFIPDGTFPEPLCLTSNVDYVRGVLGGTVRLTADRESWKAVDSLPNDADFFRYQAAVNPREEIVESHDIIERRIKESGEDYRFEVGPNPVPELRKRDRDNTDVGRKVPVASARR